MKAVVLAGGKGTRLRPFTYILPKPLLPINERSILEININYLKKFGVNEIIIADSLLYGKMIETIIGDGGKFGISIKYSYEDKPLSTAGPLSLVKDMIDDIVFVFNADILHNIKYSSLLDSHNSSNADISIASYSLEHKVDLGVLNHSGNVLEEYVEKPTYSYDVSMGLYCINRDIICNYITDNTPLDFPTLINSLIKDKKKINIFKHSGLWKDLGTPSEYNGVNDSLASLREQYPEIPI